MATIEQVKNANSQWFSPKTKKFLGDRSYSVLHSKTGKPYLLRSTYQWSDMFGQPKKLTYKINRIDPETLKIKSLYDQEFYDRKEAKEFIKQGYTELIDKQRELIRQYLDNCGYTHQKAIDECLNVCSQIPILITDYYKYVYPEYEKILDELLSYKTPKL